MKYDSAIIEEFANKLYKKANSIVLSYTLWGLIIGGIGGSISTKGELAIIMALITAIVGNLLAREKAFQLKLQAQTALCQLKIEENTRKNYPNSAHSQD